MPRLRWPGKALVLAMCIPVALAANVARIVLMTLAAHRWGTGIIGNDTFHLGLGIFVFVLAFLLFFAVESALLLLAPQRLAAAPEEES